MPAHAWPQEWEHQLLVLAESMSMHCHTRSADEIIAFMKGEEVGAAKRMAARSSDQTEKASEHEHAHEHVGCPDGDACTHGLCVPTAVATPLVSFEHEAAMPQAVEHEHGHMNRYEHSAAIPSA